MAVSVITDVARNQRPGQLIGPSLAGVLLLLIALTARASGPANSGLVAVADNATAAAANPAGLTRIERSEWDGQVVALATESTDQTGTSGGARRSASSSNNFAIPAVYYARRWNDRIGLGISLTVPAGIGSDPGDSTIGRYLLEKWSLGYASLAPAVGYRISDRLSLGFALNLNYAAYEYKSAVYNGPGQADGEMKFDGNSFAVGFRAGVLYEIEPATRLGLIYQSATTSSFSGTPDFSGLSQQRQAILEAVGVFNRPITLETKFPQIVIAGGYHQFANRLSATFDVAWVDFSQFGLTQVTLGNTNITASQGKNQDIWAATAGLGWPVAARWDAQLGLAYATPGVSDANRTFALRLDRIWGIGAGATYHFSQRKSLAVDLTYYNLGTAPVSVTVPLLGSLSAGYSSNYALALKVALRWQP